MKKVHRQYAGRLRMIVVVTLALAFTLGSALVARVEAAPPQQATPPPRPTVEPSPPPRPLPQPTLPPRPTVPGPTPGAPGQPPRGDQDQVTPTLSPSLPVGGGPGDGRLLGALAGILMGGGLLLAGSLLFYRHT